MELNFTHGVQEYTVHGVNGDAVIRFNPTDGEFVQRLYHAFEVLDKKKVRGQGEDLRDRPETQRRDAGDHRRHL